MHMRYVLSLCGCFVGLLTPHVWAEPKITNCNPGAVAPNATTRLILHGDRFFQPIRIWTSFPAKVDVLAIEQKQLTLSITTDLRVPLGPAGLAVATCEGASEPIALVVDDLPSISDNGENHGIDQAQRIESFCAVDGVSDGSAFDYYRFRVDPGQRIAFDCLARRLNSHFDPMIRLLDEKGYEILSVDDDLSLGTDCRFSRVFSTAGDFLLEVRDSKYASGGRYRLRIGDFPLIDTAYPLAGRIGETRMFSFTGSDAKLLSPVLSLLPNDPLVGFTQLSARLPDGKSSAWTEVSVGSYPEMSEAEPNDQLDQATKVIIPCGFSGQLGSPGDRDNFEFVAVTGQTARFAATTLSLGSPTLLVMRLHHANGSKLAETVVTDADEWSFDFTFTADGVYRLQVEDLLQRGGPEHNYHVSVRPSGSFELALRHDETARDRFALEPAIGGCALDLEASRFGYDGPIEVSLLGSDAGVSLLNPIIPAKTNASRIYIQANSGYSPNAFALVRILGRSVENPRFETLARSTQLLRNKAPHSLVPPRWRDGLLSLSGIPASEPFFNLKLTEEPAIFSGPLAVGTAMLVLERKQPEFKDAVTILPDPLPEGFTASVKIDKDKYTVSLAGPRDLVREALKVRLIAFASFNQRGCFQALEIPFIFVNP